MLPDNLNYKKIPTKYIEMQKKQMFLEWHVLVVLWRVTLYSNGRE